MLSRSVDSLSCSYDTNQTVLPVQIAGATVFVFWEPDLSSDVKKFPHEIFSVGGAIEVRCRHTELDMDNIAAHVTSYLRPLNNGKSNK